MDQLLQVLLQMTHLSEQEMALVKRLWCTEHQLKRKELLIEAGQTERRLHFILSGTFRIYYATEKEDLVAGFGYPNTLICSFPSFVKGLPSSYSIEALEPAKLISISKDELLQLRKECPGIDAIWQQAIEEALLGRIERETELLTLTPKERYEQMMQRSPHIFQLFARKHIASYLGMTPETLSRVSSQ